MKSKRTPLPWKISDSANPCGVFGICSADGLHVATVGGYGATPETNRANAELTVASVNAGERLAQALAHFLTASEDTNWPEAVAYVPELASALESARAALAKL
jgi:uncharacterized protein YqfA (UPF0365 family)